jgi:hypothetical protein
MKLKRVAMRLREQFQDNPFKEKDLEDAIFIEVGTDPRTIRGATEKMLRLKLMEKVGDEKREFGVMPTIKYRLPPAQDECF